MREIKLDGIYYTRVGKIKSAADLLLVVSLCCLRKGGRKKDKSVQTYLLIGIYLRLLR
jgi:hypothetical protein